MVCDLFCMPVDVTPFIFIHTHILMVISSTVLGYEIEAVEISTIEQYMGWDSQLSLKSLK